MATSVNLESYRPFVLLDFVLENEKHCKDCGVSQSRLKVVDDLGCLKIHNL